MPAPVPDCCNLVGKFTAVLAVRSTVCFQFVSITSNRTISSSSSIRSSGIVAVMLKSIPWFALATVIMCSSSGMLAGNVVSLCMFVGWSVGRLVV